MNLSAIRANFEIRRRPSKFGIRIVGIRELHRDVPGRSLFPEFGVAESVGVELPSEVSHAAVNTAVLKSTVLAGRPAKLTSHGTWVRNVVVGEVLAAREAESKLVAFPTLSKGSLVVEGQQIHAEATLVALDNWRLCLPEQLLVLNP